jgi:hypothetical protein
MIRRVVNRIGSAVLAFALCGLSLPVWADGWPVTSPTDPIAIRPGQPTTGLFIVHSQGNTPGSGDWVSSGGGGATHYSYFIEVPPATTNLIVEIFDPDVLQGGTGEGTATSLPHYDQQRTTGTATNYLLVNPTGTTVQTINGTSANPAASHATWFGFATVASPANGHWEVRVDSLSSGGNVSGYGIRTRATVNGAIDTQLRIYADAHLSVQHYGVNTLYVAHPYVTGYCQVRVRDYDVDAATIGALSSIRLESSVPGTVFQTFTGASLSGDGGNWNANDTTVAWHLDAQVTRPGIYTTEISSRSTGATNEFQVGFYNPNGFADGVNPTVPAVGASWANSWRTYLPTPTNPVTVRGTAPVKPYLTQQLFHAGDGSPNPPVLTETGNYDVVIQMVNPTAYPITFSDTNLIRSHVPGGQVVRAATAINVSQGGPASLVNQPAFPGGSGFIEWNPGTVAAGQTVTMAYRVAVSPAALGRIIATGTPAANGTTARYLDETANAAQPRATYEWGPLCELAVSTNVPLDTPATLAKVSSQRVGESLIVDLRTAVQVGVAYHELLEPARDGSGWAAVEGSQTPAPLDHLEAASIRLQARTSAPQFMLRSVDIDGRSMLHGPFQSGASIGADPDSHSIPWPQIRAELSAFEGSGRGTTPSADAYDLQVQRAGIARLRFEDLPNADWQGAALAGIGLFDRNTPVPIRVVSADGVFGPGDALEFIADEPTGIYSASRVYQLRKDQPQPARVSERRAVVDVGGLADMIVQRSTTFDTDAIYNFSSPLSDPWQADRLLSTPSSPLTRSYTLQVDPSQTGVVHLTGALLGGIDWGDGEMDHQVQIAVNGSAVQSLSFDALEVKLFEFALPEGVIQAGSNSVSLTLPAPLRTDIVWLEHIGLRYHGDPPVVAGSSRFTPVPGDYADIPAADQLLAADFELSAPGDSCVGIDGENFCQALRVSAVDAATARVYRRHLDGSVQALIDPAATADGIVWAEPRTLGREIVVADETGLVEISASVASEAVTLVGQAELLIVAHPLFMDTVESLANRRRAQGLSVQTVSTDAAYSRYSGGNFDPQAIDQLITDATLGHATRYVLLVGADSYDYQDRLGLGSVSFLPSHYVRVHPVVNHAPTDALYADSDGDRLADVAIGRLPVRTIAELDLVLQKIDAYESSGAAAPSLFIADDADANGGSFGNNSELLRARLSGASQTAYLDEIPASEVRQRLLSAATAGADMIHFLGHSSPSTWTFPAPGLITPTELYAGALSSAVRPTIVTQWGCWNSYLAAPRNDSLGHAWLLGPGAAVAVIGATSLTEVDHDVFLSYRLLDRWNAPQARIGDALLQAKRDLAESDPRAVDVLLGTTLFGDPTLRRQP